VLADFRHCGRPVHKYQVDENYGEKLIVVLTHRVVAVVLSYIRTSAVVLLNRTARVVLTYRVFNIVLVHQTAQVVLAVGVDIVLPDRIFGVVLGKGVDVVVLPDRVSSVGTVVSIRVEGRHLLRLYVPVQAVQVHVTNPLYAGIFRIC